MFLKSPEGAFYTSHPTDVVRGRHSGEYFTLGDADRRARGIPRVDVHRYARENAWVVNALVTLYGVSDDRTVLEPGRRPVPGPLPRGRVRLHREPLLGAVVHPGRACVAHRAAARG